MLTRNRPEGERFWASERRLHYNDLHFHDYYELELVLEGTARESVNTLIYEAKPRTLALLSPHDFHSVEAPHGQTVRYFTLGVCPEELSAEVRELLELARLPLVLSLTPTRHEQLLADLRALVEVMQGAKKYRILAVRRYIELILIAVLEWSRDSELASPTAQSIERKGASDVLAAKQYIDEHYAEPISRSELAAALHYSPNYFSTLFAATVGASFSDYLTEVRLSHAYELLQGGNATVKSVMNAVGFRSPTVFFHVFKERFGCLPSAVICK